MNITTVLLITTNVLTVIIFALIIRLGFQYHVKLILKYSLTRSVNKVQIHKKNSYFFDDISPNDM